MTLCTVTCTNLFFSTTIWIQKGRGKIPRPFLHTGILLDRDLAGDNVGFDLIELGLQGCRNFAFKVMERG